MTRHTISLPQQMSAYIDAQLNSGQYGNVSEYFRDLIRRDQALQQRTIVELKTLLDRAEASGISPLSFNEIKEAAQQKYANANNT